MTVRIIYTPVLATRAGGKAWIEVHPDRSRRAGSLRRTAQAGIAARSEGG